MHIYFLVKVGECVSLSDQLLIELISSITANLIVIILLTHWNILNLFQLLLIPMFPLKATEPQPQTKTFLRAYCCGNNLLLIYIPLMRQCV